MEEDVYIARLRRNWAPRGPRIYLKITRPLLAEVFNVSLHTINSYIYRRQLDPTNLESIINLYISKRDKILKRKEKRDLPDCGEESIDASG